MSDPARDPLPPPLSTALARLRAAHAAICERSAASLNLGAVSCITSAQRVAIMLALGLLDRHRTRFDDAFADALREGVTQDWLPRSRAMSAEMPSNWDSLSLVDDDTLNARLRAERFGLSIGANCEWELRELDAYVRALADIADGAGSLDRRNPLRPEIIGQAVIRSLEDLQADPEAARVLETELAGSWKAELPGIYAAIKTELRAGGVEPLTLAAPRRHARAGQAGPATAAGSRPEPVPGSAAGGPGPFAAPHPSVPQGTRTIADGTPPPAQAAAASVPMGFDGLQEPIPMLLLRRLAASPLLGGAVDIDLSELPGRASAGGPTDGAASPVAIRNLIQTHRDELVHAARSSMDHMVIDVVGSLFEHILADPKVPPQIARQIGRLQLPVLRTALGDPSFFASRRHPVRRLVNRIASLGAALDNLAPNAADALVAQIAELVQSIVDGDFDRLDIYEAQLRRLEEFLADQGRRTIEEQGAARLLADREAELRTHRGRMRQLQTELQPLPAPDFVRDFLADTWCQVLLRAARLQGPTSEAVRGFRTAGRDLLLSVQPKGTPAQRQAFLAQLPRLMQQLHQGMDMIGWPEAERHAFFGRLLPAHAQSLKGEGLSTLDYNLLTRQVDAVLERAVPAADELAHVPSSPVPLDSGHAPLLTAGEAATVGLLTDEAVDWSAKPEADRGEEQPLVTADLAIQGLPEPEAPEPTRGKGLAAHLQIGVAYQMHVEGRWHKVRLNHISPGRTFYVFSRGQRHQQAISLTHRMVVRLCEADRLRAFEAAYLLERAQARARRQLAALRPAAATA